MAVDYQNAISVLMGTTLGMIVADAVGIIIGVVLCKRIPQRTIKWFSASIFIIFGLVGVYEILAEKIPVSYNVLIATGLAAFSILMAYLLSKRERKRAKMPSESKICKSPSG